MGFRNDFNEAKELWSNSSLLTKIFVCVTLFLTTSSIASLSDVVFKWKGFVLDGIAIYRDWLVAPITDYSSYIGLKYSVAEIDALILLDVLFVVPYFRTLLFPWRKINSNLEYSVKIKRGAIAAFVSIIALHLLVGASGNESSILILSVAFLGTFWLLVLPSKGLKAAYTELYGSVKKYRIVYAGPILFAITTMLILGAINSGLTRVVK